MWGSVHRKKKTVEEAVHWEESKYETDNRRDRTEEHQTDNFTDGFLSCKKNIL